MNNSRLRNGTDVREFIDAQIQDIRTRTNGGRALCALSGGVDSMVCAFLTHTAIGDALTCVFVDHGLLRKNESNEVTALCRERLGSSFIHVDASERFLELLVGVSSPEEKRKIIGAEFISVFEDEASKLGDGCFLVQGTIYPDVTESGKDGAKLVKSHHNVGGMPDKTSFRGIIEPLRSLYKDEVRQVGRELGIPEETVARQPFPGPGLAVRVVGEFTRDKLRIAREADAIFREELSSLPPEILPSQYFALVTATQSVGIKDGERAYGYTVALRAIDTHDFVTARFSALPPDTLRRVSSRVMREVDGVSRVVYDVSDKPYATIEWE